MRSILHRMLAVLGLLSCLHGDVLAQSIGGPHNIPRIYGPGARTDDSLPFSHRYHYYSGPAFYLNGSAHEMWQLDYLDRLDRAERFGYPPPLPPRHLSEPIYHHRPRIFGGLGYRFFPR